MAKIAAHFVAAMAISIAANATSPNANVQYVGFDWLDASPSPVDPNTSYAGISSTGPSAANMNVVHSIASLNSAACADQKCALNIGAG
ncbi:MAG: hypothetical protein KF686_14075, partial [Ramlibacter sp.]|nr:hypothetical protein [Ramlibacter sp.]